jgi:hypothetical protein
MSGAGFGEKIVKLADAIEDGEILRVRYHGGTQPGAVREIRPIFVDSVICRAFDLTVLRARSFRLERLEFVGSDEPVTYRPGKERRDKISAVFTNKHDALRVLNKYTENWAFNVPMLFADSLDVVVSIRVHKNKETKKESKLYFVSVGNPPDYAFRPNDVFHFPRNAAFGAWGALARHWSLQVSKSDVSPDRIEFVAASYVHGKVDRCRHEVSLSAGGFVNLLRFGPDAEEWAAVFGDQPAPPVSVTPLENAR